MLTYLYTDQITRRIGGACGRYRTFILWIFSPSLRPLKLHKHIGADDRSRTYNLLFTRQLHYHCATSAYLAVTPPSGSDFTLSLTMKSFTFLLFKVTFTAVNECHTHCGLSVHSSAFSGSEFLAPH